MEEPTTGVISRILRGVPSLSMSPFAVQMASGKTFNLDKPDPSDVDIEDIAHHLAHLCRFTGGTSSHYSVAQHCVHVSRLVPPEFQLWGLLHDAAEAYVGDITTPLKRLVPQLERAEKNVQRVICTVFGIPADMPPCVFTADRTMLVVEARALLQEHAWHNQVQGADYVEADRHPRLKPLRANAAKWMFMERFSELVARQGHRNATEVER